jgi:hypothetical protein
MEITFTTINESIIEKNHWYYSWEHHSSHTRSMASNMAILLQIMIMLLDYSKISS